MLCLDEYIEVPVIELLDDDTPVHSNGQFRLETQFNLNESLVIDGNECLQNSPDTVVHVTEVEI